MALDYNNIDTIIESFDKVLKLSSIGGSPSVPVPLILVGIPKRSGLSPTKIASRIIARKSEAGLPVGVLPSGAISPDEIMERIRIEEIVKALQQEAIITVAINQGIPIQAAGISPTGPVTVFGSTIYFAKGYAIIQ